MGNWKPRDFVVAGVFIVAGLILSRVLSEELWLGIGTAVFVASFWWPIRQSRRRQSEEGARPPRRDWTPPLRGGGSDS